jgi:hypothetical protein
MKVEMMSPPLGPLLGGQPRSLTQRQGKVMDFPRDPR